MSTKKNAEVSKIGDRIRSFRIENDLTLVQLANLIKISHGSLSGLENNKSKPSAETLANFCLYTEINIEWLLTGKGNKKRKEKRQEIQDIRRQFEILNDAEEWLAEEIQRNPNRKIWFELHLLDSFQSFKMWREERKGAETYREDTPVSKVA